MSATKPMPTGATIRTEIDRPDVGVIDAARALPAATLHEAGGRIGVGVIGIAKPQPQP